MTKSISLVNTAADTFQAWVNKTNEIANAVSQECVTVNSHANGGLSTGNGFVEGTFGARNLVANTLRGGTVQNPALLTITSNVTITGNQLVIGSVTVNTTDIVVGGQALSGLPVSARIANATNGLTAQAIYAFAKLTYRGADFTLTIKDSSSGGANAYQISKLLVVHDSGNAVTTEYGVVYSNTSQGQLFSNVSANGTHIMTYLTPTAANTTISGTVTLIGV